MPVSLTIGKHTLCVLGVGDRPAESLDELRCGVTVAEMFWADVLVEQHWIALLGRHDDPDHDRMLSPIGDVNSPCRRLPGVPVAFAALDPRP